MDQREASFACKGMLKKGASGVLGPLACSRTAVYALRANEPAALLDLALPKRLRAGERAFLNIPYFLLMCYHVDQDRLG